MAGSGAQAEEHGRSDSIAGHIGVGPDAGSGDPDASETTEPDATVGLGVGQRPVRTRQGTKPTDMLAIILEVLMMIALGVGLASVIYLLSQIKP